MLSTSRIRRSSANHQRNAVFRLLRDFSIDKGLVKNRQVFVHVLELGRRITTIQLRPAFGQAFVYGSKRKIAFVLTMS